MLWKFRAVNNRIAKRKYYMYSLGIVLILLIGAIYRLETGTSAGKVAILMATGVLFVFMYTLIALGKERFYSMNEYEIVYRPLRTKIEDIESFEVDEENKLIKLNLKRGGLFSVKTLYFEDPKDLKEAEYFLRKFLKT